MELVGSHSSSSSLQYASYSERSSNTTPIHNTTPTHHHTTSNHQFTEKLFDINTSKLFDINTSKLFAKNPPKLFDNNYDDYCSVGVSELYTPGEKILEDLPPTIQFYSPSLGSAMDTPEEKVMRSCPKKHSSSKNHYNSPRIHLENIGTFTQDTSSTKPHKNRSLKHRKCLGVFNDITNRTIRNEKLLNLKQLYSLEKDIKVKQNVEITMSPDENKFEEASIESTRVAICEKLVSFYPYRTMTSMELKKSVEFKDIDQTIFQMTGSSSYISHHYFNSKLNSARIKLIEWIFDFVYSYKLNIECAFLTVQIVDIILADHSDAINCTEYQLYAVAALYISSKLFDVTHISIKDCLFTTCDQYSYRDITDAELAIFGYPKLNFYTFKLIHLLEALYTKFVPFFIEVDYSLKFITYSEILLMCPTILQRHTLLDISLALVCIVASENNRIDYSLLRGELIKFSTLKNILVCSKDVLSAIASFDFKLCPSTNIRFNDFLINFQISDFLAFVNYLLH